MDKCRLNLGFSALSVTVVLFQAALETMRWKELEETRERAAKLRGEGLASRNSAGVRPVTTLRCWETSDRPIYRFGGHLEFYFSQKDIMEDLESKCTHGCGYKFGLILFHAIINLRQKNVEHVHAHDMHVCICPSGHPIIYIQDGSRIGKMVYSCHVFWSVTWSTAMFIF